MTTRWRGVARRRAAPRPLARVRDTCGRSLLRILLSPPSDAQVFENAKRIFREIRILRLMDHPNIVKIAHVQQPK